MKKDINNLPVTRKGLLLDSIKNRGFLLLKIGFIIGLFFIPFLISSFFKDYYISNLVLNADYYNNGSFTEEGINIYQSLNTIFSIIDIALIFIFLVCLSGIKKIFIKISWSEGVLFWNDFKMGVKQNYKSDLLIGIIFSMIYFLINYFSTNTSNIIIQLVFYFVIFLIFFPLLIIDFLYTGIYVVNFKNRVKNVTILYLKNLPISLLISLLFCLFFLLRLLPYTLIVIKQAITLICMFIVAPLIYLTIQMIASYIFDKDINKTIHPEIYRKGLY